jgi:cellulose synthase/poly-beta-1,6-N-acetylglucosamine synthase-like glycosyltransferase
LQGITGASVFTKAHSMCNGANLTYTKKAFEEVGGFAGIDAIASGDDMLLMHKIYKQYPDGIFFLKSEEVIVQTKPMQTLKAFINQRIRWASKADKYDDKRIFAVLLLVYFFNVWCLVLFFIPPSLCPIPFFPLIILMLKCTVELFFLYPVAKFFGQQKILWWFPVAQPFHILYTIVAGWLGKFGSYQWKERKVH